MIGVSLGALGGLVIGTREGSLVGLSLVFTIKYPFEYPNTRYVLPGTLLVTSLGLWFGSEFVRC